MMKTRCGLEWLVPSKENSAAIQSGTEPSTTNAIEESSSRYQDDKMLRLNFRFTSYFTKTLDELNSQLKSRQVKWKRSSQYIFCVAEFKKMKAAGFRITNIVALGVGSLQQALGDGYSSDDKENGAMLQLAVLMTFRKVLGGTSSVLLEEPVEIMSN
jgi:hypothetical protein